MDIEITAIYCQSADADFPASVGHRDDPQCEMNTAEVMTTALYGIQAEMFLSPGSYSDTSSVYYFNFSVHEHSFIHGDKAYNVYDVEDELKEKNIYLIR